MRKIMHSIAEQILQNNTLSLKNEKVALVADGGTVNGTKWYAVGNLKNSSALDFFETSLFDIIISNGDSTEDIKTMINEIKIKIEEQKDGRFLIKVKASINAMEYWAMQYLNSVEILSPLELRERLKKNIATANEKYKD